MEQHSTHDLELPGVVVGSGGVGSGGHGSGHRGWKAEELADQTGHDHAVSMAGALLLLGIVTSCDLVLIYATISRVFFTLGEAQAWLLAVGLTVASVALMFWAGRVTRIGNAVGWTGTQRLLAVALVGGWCVLGACLFWLRWNAAAFAPAEVSYDGGGAAAGGATNEQLERMLAVVLIGVYLATGALAWLDGYKLTNLAAQAMRRARRQLDRVNIEVAQKSARVARLADNLGIHQQDIDSVDEHRDTARRAREALAAELKEHARVQIALNLGDVTATSLVHDRPRRAGQRP